MSLNKNSQTPPPTMTWRRASPVLIACGLVDATRMFFTLFWFFGPALAAAYCTNEASGWVGTTIGAAGCSAATATAGYFLSPALAMFGVIMAMAVGLLGWMTVYLYLLVKNPRIFTANAMGMVWLLLGLGVSELPFLGALPALTGTTWRLYRTQIHKEKKELQEWKQAHAAEQAREREAELTYLRQVQQAQQQDQEQQLLQEEAVAEESANKEVEQAIY